MSRLFLVDNLDTCDSELIQTYKDNPNFKKTELFAYHFSIQSLPNYKDSLNSDSTSVRFLEFHMNGVYPEYDVTQIELVRYFSEIRNANDAYNKLVSILLKQKFFSVEHGFSRTDTQGVILANKLDIIIETGLLFHFENDPDLQLDHNLRLSLEYVLDYENKWRLKNEYLLKLIYTRKKIDC